MSTPTLFPIPRHQKLNGLSQVERKVARVPSLYPVISFFSVPSSSTQFSIVFYKWYSVLFYFFHCPYCSSLFFPEGYPRHTEWSTMEPPLIFSEVAVVCPLNWGNLSKRLLCGEGAGTGVGRAKTESNSLFSFFSVVVPPWWSFLPGFYRQSSWHSSLQIRFCLRLDVEEDGRVWNERRWVKGGIFHMWIVRMLSC